MALAHERISTRAAVRRPATALSVCGWELRRQLASRTTPILGAALALFFTAIVLFKHTWLLQTNDATHAGITVLASTAWGGMYAIVGVLLLFFGMVVPFLATDAVARDQRQRTHELLMTTLVTSTAYVGGRFLAALAACLSGAVVVAVAVLAANVLLSLSDPTYPAPQVGPFLAAWLVLMLPAAVLLAGAGFLGGTLLPRLTMAVKLLLLLLWVGLDLITDVGRWTDWFPYWTPSGKWVIKTLLPGLVERYTTAASGLDAAGQRQLALTVQQQPPDLWPWVGPHLGLALAGLAAGAVAALTFRRFRAQLG
jgi:hypothetical protein